MRRLVLTDDEFAELKAAIQYRIKEIAASGDDIPKELTAITTKIAEAPRSR